MSDLLLHFNTDFSDSSGNGHTITAAGIGVSSINTSIKKFGAGSVQLNVEYLKGDASSAFAFGTGDFTVDFWWRTALAAATSDMFSTHGENSATPGFIIRLTSSSKVTLVVDSTTQITGTTSLTANVFHHIAVTRSSGSTRLFLNGAQEGSTYSDSNNYTIGTSGPLIGASAGGTNPATQQYFDEVRIIKGSAYWTSGFTPETSEWAGAAQAWDGYARFNGAGSLRPSAQKPGVHDASNFVRGAGSLSVDTFTIEATQPAAEGSIGESLQYLDAYPLIKSIDFQPAIVSLGNNLGQRATLTVTFKDAKHSDPGPDWDKYASERTYTDPYNRGTFWGKFRARNPFLRGRSIRLYRGELGQDPDNMEVHHFIIDSIDGPNVNGDFKIVAKDVLKLTDGDRSQAPTLSEGFLVADITAGATSLTLSPTGIGSTSNYGSSGWASIGGNEIVSYNRSGDTMTITRAQLNTVAVAHSAQDRVQEVIRYSSQDPADIIYDLMTSYAGISTGYITQSEWQTETATNLGVVSTFNVAEPTSVAELISELIELFGLAIWWDDETEKIKLQVLRSISTTADRYNEDNTLEDTLNVREQPNSRISQVIVYFAQINPLLKKDELTNYRSSAIVIDEQSEEDEGSAAIKKIYARGIASGGRSIAEQAANKYLSRYVSPPRQFTFELMRFADVAPELGGGYQLGGGDPLHSSWPFQDETGDRVDVPIQVTRLNPLADKFVIEAEEMLFTEFGSAIDPNTHTIIFDTNQNDINLEEVHDDLYPVATNGQTVNCYINTGVIIGSTSTSTPAFTVGSFAAGVTVNVYVSGRIQGKGGNGGTPTGSTTPPAGYGESGGTALYTRETINLILSAGDAQIWGGGGGGGGGFLGGARGGGGGAGTLFGTGGTGNLGNGSDGTSEAGGGSGGGTSGAGGGPGLSGSNGTAGSYTMNGGSAGTGIDGVSFCTKTGTGDIRGSQVN